MYLYIFVSIFKKVSFGTLKIFIVCYYSKAYPPTFALCHIKLPSVNLLNASRPSLENTSSSTRADVSLCTFHWVSAYFQLFTSLFKIPSGTSSVPSKWTCKILRE